LAGIQSRNQATLDLNQTAAKRAQAIKTVYGGRNRIYLPTFRRVASGQMDVGVVERAEERESVDVGC